MTTATPQDAAREMRADVEALMVASYGEDWPWCPTTSAVLDLLLSQEEEPA